MTFLLATVHVSSLPGGEALTRVLSLCHLQGIYTCSHTRLTCVRLLQRRGLWAWQRCGGCLCRAAGSEPAWPVASVLQRVLVRPALPTWFVLTLGLAKSQGCAKSQGDLPVSMHYH